MEDKAVERMWLQEGNWCCESFVQPEKYSQDQFEFERKSIPVHWNTKDLITSTSGLEVEVKCACLTFLCLSY